VLPAQSSEMPTKTMIIMQNYRLDGKTSKYFFMTQNETGGTNTNEGI
jgi:hypothetical protein